MTSRVDDLKDLRALLWESIRAADPEKRAPLAARLESVVAALALIDAETPKAGDPVDEIAARRAARGGATSRLGQAPGRPS